MRTGCCRTAVTSRALQQSRAGAEAQTRAAGAGNPRLMKEAGLRLVLGREGPCSPSEGVKLIEAAARLNNADAWHCLALLAVIGLGTERSLVKALAALRRAAELGHGHAARQIRLLAGAGLNDATDLESWLAPPPMRILRHEPRFSVSEGFLSPLICAHLRGHAAPRLERAKVYDVQQHRLKEDPMRTNTGSAFSLIDTDVVMQLVRQRIAAAAGVGADALEPPEVLHYSPGEQYRLHVDFFHVSVPHFAELVRQRGQRVMTCLIYLNADYEGGETDFPKLDFRFRGATGDALIFSNVGADGCGDMNTAHAGLAPTRGAKWLFSQWIRNKAQLAA